MNEQEFKRQANSLEGLDVYLHSKQRLHGFAI